MRKTTSSDSAPIAPISKSGLRPVVWPDTETLILGTMPGERSLEEKQYYANPGNQFRRLLFAALASEFETGYSPFLQLLQRNKVGLWSMVRSCERTGSADSAIRNLMPNDLPEFLDRHPKIRKIGFESKKAEQWHDRFFERAPHIKYGSLPSASGLYAKMGFEQKLALYRAFLKSS